ncbi:YfbR-like 5'-deoxynucleotidase [Aggregatibacter actinomycetemcomitans]|uniref:YfbR-like 5'-deoxynucleotidase n=1 Tax=Aggregatibacter actinomycetemcomitans TaxID=714 RepID=UPI000D691F0D|nr:YfbR-like 5'-deoxynucleotidase [Aggregatibacter actinomycetemcomitans]
MSIFITHGNRLIDFANAQNSDIHIDDIIHHLSMIPRFAGKLDVHYTVLDHSVYVGMIAKSFLGADDMTAYAALMHDAQEAYLGDLPTPLKNLLPGYRAIEHAFELAIQDRFCIKMTPKIKRLVKMADLLALKAEKKAFIATPPEHEKHWAYLNGFDDIPLSPKAYKQDSKETFKRAFIYYNRSLNLGLDEA